MKLILAALSLAAGVYCSRLLTRPYLQRKRILRALLGDIAALETYVCYYGVPLSQALTRLKGEHGEVYARMAEELDSCREEFSVLFARELEAEGFRSLTGEDRRSLTDFAVLLGEGDTASQQALFAGIRRTLQGQLDSACREVEVKVGLYRTLGFVGGVVMGIMVI